MPMTEPTATTDAYRKGYADGAAWMMSTFASVPQKVLHAFRRVQLWAARISPEGDSETPPEGGVRA